MRTLTLILCLISTSAMAQTAVLQERVQPDGSHVWTYVTSWPKKSKFTPEQREELLMNSISLSMSNQRLCPSGWDIIDRNEQNIGWPNGNTLILQGKCK